MTKSKTYDEVQQMNITTEALLNITCDSQASAIQTDRKSIPDAAVLPTECYGQFTQCNQLRGK
jgi:hypothetical protein